MYGQGEFADLHGAEGLQTLLEAADSAGPAHGAQSPGLDAQGGHDVANADQIAASPDRQVTPRAFEGGPDIKDLIMPRLEAARNISNTNKPASEKLNGWKPLQTKPRKDELWQAILERDSTKKPKNWQVNDMVKYLMNTSPTTPGAQGVVGNSEGQDTVVPETTAIVATTTPPSTDAPGPKQRWSRNKFARVIGIICSDDFKNAFITRDRKLDRQEMDAKGADSFWEKVSLVFNSSKVFDIDRVGGTERFKTLSGAPTAYTADAAKLKYEFGQMRASLTKAMVNFQKSGQGDDHAAEEGEGGEGGEPAEAPVCGSNFRDFCNGDELLEYFEFMLRKADLLDAATCNMPKEAQYSSDSKRRCTDQLPKPRPKKHKTGKDSVAAFMSAIRTLPSLKVHKSRVQQAAEKAHSIRMLVKTHAGLEKMVSKQELKLKDAELELERLHLQTPAEELDSSGDDDSPDTALKMARAKVKQMKQFLSLLKVKQDGVMRNLEEDEEEPADSQPEDEDEDEEDEEVS